MKNQLRNLICYPFYNSFYIPFCGSCVAILLLFIPILFLSGCSAQKDYVLSDDDNKYAFLTEEDSGGKKNAGNDFDIETEQSENVANAKQGEGNVEPDAEDEKHMIYVDICGAVHSPGVYSFHEGARVFEVIAAAGGLTDDACLESVNRAENVSDGQKLYILTKIEWEQQKSDGILQADTEADDGLVNVNNASESELCTLPGIGATRAQAIIAYREEQGGFATIEEIQNVSGIKSGTYEKIKDLIKVN